MLEELGEVGEHRHEALRTARRDLTKIGRLARKGVGADMTLSEIAEAAGISRVTLDKLLDKKPVGSRTKKSKP